MSPKKSQKPESETSPTAPPSTDVADTTSAAGSEETIASVLDRIRTEGAASPVTPEPASVVARPRFSRSPSLITRRAVVTGIGVIIALGLIAGLVYALRPEGPLLGVISGLRGRLRAASSDHETNVTLPEEIILRIIVAENVDGVWDAADPVIPGWIVLADTVHTDEFPATGKGGADARGPIVIAPEDIDAAHDALFDAATANMADGFDTLVEDGHLLLPKLITASEVSFSVPEAGEPAGTFSAELTLRRKALIFEEYAATALLPQGFHVSGYTVDSFDTTQHRAVIFLTASSTP